MRGGQYARVKASHYGGRGKTSDMLHSHQNPSPVREPSATAQTPHIRSHCYLSEAIDQQPTIKETCVFQLETHVLGPVVPEPCRGESSSPGFHTGERRVAEAIRTSMRIMGVHLRELEDVRAITLRVKKLVTGVRYHLLLA